MEAKQEKRKRIIYPKCVIYQICRSKASGEQKDDKGKVFYLCSFHKNIFDLFGSAQFSKKYKIWINKKR
jgi:hypothetical protein